MRKSNDTFFVCIVGFGVAVCCGRNASDHDLHSKTANFWTVLSSDGMPVKSKVLYSQGDWLRGGPLQLRSSLGMLCFFFQWVNWSELE